MGEQQQRTWLLSCGHSAQLTDYELEQHAKGTLTTPRRPRRCQVCQQQRNVVGGTSPTTAY